MSTSDYTSDCTNDSSENANGLAAHHPASPYLDNNSEEHPDEHRSKTNDKNSSDISISSQVITLDNAPGILAVIAQDGSILKGNNYLGRLLNCSFDDVVHNNLSAIFTSANWKIFQKQLIHSENNNHSEFILNILQLNQCLKIPANYLWQVSYLGNYIYYHQNNEQINLFAVNGKDITEIREDYNKLRMANQKLESLLAANSQKLREAYQQLQQEIDARTEAEAKLLNYQQTMDSIKETF